MVMGEKRRRERQEFKINPNKFFKLILPHILDQNCLRVPETFAKEFTPQLPTSVALTIRTGLSWKILLNKIEDKLCFTQGWDNFMENNNIKHGYFLEFEYEGNNHFKVHIFDLSCQEIDYPIECGEHAKQKIPRIQDHDAKDISGGTISESNSKNPSFTIRLRKYSIAVFNPYLHMPKNFTMEHMELMKGNLYKSVTLQAGDGREWTVDCYYDQSIRLIGSKWKKFVEENNCDVGEAYTFVLVNRKGDSATFKVSKE